MTDPRDAEPRPPFPDQPQELPGTEAAMTPTPDHGEETYRGSDRLVDKVAVITGADSGIGRAVALAFAREGADVVVSYLDEHDDAAATVAVVEEAGRRAITIPGDIGDPAHCRQIVEQALDAFGRLDLLVNNAGMQLSRERLTDIPDGEVEQVFRTNIVSMFHLTKAAVPHMAPGSSIINTASVQAFHPSPDLLPYAATKAAIVNFTQNLAQSLADDGIRVNGVAPGPVWTPLIPASFDEERVRSFGGNYPIGRPAQPGELAPLYVFLASEESRYLSGQIIGATGGKPVP